MVILGISAFYHDSAAALLEDGKLIAAAQEERFTRKKHDASLPIHAIASVMEEARIEGKDISYVAFYEKPFLKFERLLEAYHAFAPRGVMSFAKSMPVWLKEKLYIKNSIKKALLNHFGINSDILFPEHHLSHAASAFYPSPFEEAAILTVDGVGEYATTTISKGVGRDIVLLKELSFPHSLGLLYSAFTYYCGFRVNSGEYKLMGLAPYGAYSAEMVEKIKNCIIDIREDGSFLLNMDYFNFAAGLKMVNVSAWKKLFGFPPRAPESELKQEYMDLAKAAQLVIEEVLLKLVETTKKLTQAQHLVMAGGVALNCVANGKIREQGLFKDYWIQPASGDAGGAIGAAFSVWHIFLKKERIIFFPDGMSGSYLGPSFTNGEVERFIKKMEANAVSYSDDELCKLIAGYINDGAVVGWFQGRMEFGPRALGNRSILADPRNFNMQKRVNMDIKYRENFRPFAPSVLEEDVSEYFDFHAVSPYMLQVAAVKQKYRHKTPDNYNNLSYMDKLYSLRSFFPAITHVDFSSRIQTVAQKSNPLFYKLLKSFKDLTGCGMLLNTSFNVRGEPIVCTPIDAYQCFMHTGMDFLVIGNWVFSK